MKILIIGARTIFDLRDRYDVAGTYSTNRLVQEFVKLDITKKDQVSELVKKINPDVIIHTRELSGRRISHIKDLQM